MCSSSDKKPAVHIITAASLNNVIGKNNTLPWNYPEDLRLFKQLTTNWVIIMGRKTYESIGRPLKNRINVILTLDKTYIQKVQPQINVYDERTKVIVSESIETEIENIKKHFPEKDIWIIGGASMYAYALNYDLADYIHLTRVHETIENGDTFFPPIDSEKYTMNKIKVFDNPKLTFELYTKKK